MTAYAPTTLPSPRSTFGATIAVLWMSRPTLVTPTSKPDGLLQRDPRPVRLQRTGRHLELQGLGERDMRAMDVARAVAAAELVGRKLRHAMVVDLHLFRGMAVVVY